MDFGVSVFVQLSERLRQGVKFVGSVEVVI